MSIAESAAIGFEYGFLMAIVALIQTKGDIKESATFGVAVTAAVTAFDVSLSFFMPKSERPLRESGADKYINERTKESN